MLTRSFDTICKEQSGIFFQDCSKFFTSTEFNNFASRNFNSIFRFAGIPSNTCFTGFDFKNTKTSQFNVTTIGKFLSHDIQNGLYCGSCISLG